MAAAKGSERRWLWCSDSVGLLVRATRQSRDDDAVKRSERSACVEAISCACAHAETAAMNR
ncbi:MAG: hypothetical protein V7641_3596 [Blastocatellia bacterium]